MRKNCAKKRLVVDKNGIRLTSEDSNRRSGHRTVRNELRKKEISCILLRRNELSKIETQEEKILPLRSLAGTSH